MDAFGGLDNFWDLSQHPSTFSTLPEDDFLALLQSEDISKVAQPEVANHEYRDPQTHTIFENARTDAIHNVFGTSMCTLIYTRMPPTWVFCGKIVYVVT